MTITAGEETFSPVQYNAMKIGAVSIEVDVPPGVALQRVADTMLASLESIQQREFERKLAAHLRRLREAADAAKQERSR